MQRAVQAPREAARGKQLVGIIGSGMIGRDPFDERAWSGISRQFFRACEREGLLHRAFGVEAPPHVRYPLMVKNLTFGRHRWEAKFNLDTQYYDALTAAIGRGLAPADFEHDFLQIGGIYDVPALVNGRARCFSYHDGNVAQMVKSPYMPAVPERCVRAAVDYERRVYDGLDKIFTMAEYLRASFIEDFGIDADRVVTLGAGINFDPCDAPAKDYARRDILFVGIDFARKGGPSLVRAFEQVRQKFADATLHIVGPRHRPPLLQTPRAGVEFHGFLSRADAAQRRQFDTLLQRSSLFVLPSTYEPFGVAVLEAMAHQLPCLVTDAWAFPEMVTPGVHGDLVASGDVDDLADKMIHLLGDPDALARQGAAARRKVLEHYTWAHVAGRLREQVA